MDSPLTLSDSTTGITVTATSAATKLDYEGISDACDNVLNVAHKEMKKIAKKIEKVQCGKEALAVEDKTMQPVIEEAAELVTTLPNYMEETLESVKAEALKKYNELQGIENDNARTLFNQKVAAAKANMTTNANN